MPPKAKQSQRKKDKKLISSPKVVKYKRKKRGKKSKRPSSTTSEEPDDTYLRELLPSVVLAEDPCNVKQTSLPVRMDICDFWEFLFSDRWEGRVRVCEGFLMTQLQETLESLTQKKQIMKTQIVRNFDVPVSSFIRPKTCKANPLPKKVRKTLMD